MRKIFPIRFTIITIHFHDQKRSCLRKVIMELTGAERNKAEYTAELGVWAGAVMPESHKKAINHYDTGRAPKALVLSL